LKTILTTGAGGAPATNFIRSLRSAPEPFRLIGTDADPYHLVRAEADRSYLVPPPGDPSYVEILNHLIDSEGVEFVHAQNDRELRVLSDKREQIQATMFLPDKETVAICQDKLRSYERWRDAGIKVPDTVLIRDDDDLRAALDRYGGSVWLRATEGAGGRGSLAAHDYTTARAWLDFHQGWGSFSAAELLEPSSITWMSIWRQGELVLAQGRKRLYWELAKVSPSGISGATGGGMTTSDPLLDEIATSAVLAVDSAPHGLFGVDLTYDKNGVPNPTEINIGRFFTTHHFFTALGINMPYIFVKLGCGEEVAIPEQRVNPAPDGMVWIRGIDIEPVLTSVDEIEARVEELERLKGAIAS
jgi:predicted ATP-grasp superfamily ATP-dependent carboligase